MESNGVFALRGVQPQHYYSAASSHNHSQKNEHCLAGSAGSTAYGLHCARFVYKYDFPPHVLLVMLISFINWCVFPLKALRSNFT